MNSSQQGLNSRSRSVFGASCLLACGISVRAVRGAVYEVGESGGTQKQVDTSAVSRTSQAACRGR